MLNYPVVMTQDGDRWMATFPDIPEAITDGATVEVALERAQDALETALEFYFEDKRAVPMPSKVAKGGSSITLPTSMSAKVLLLNEMVEQHVRAAELARRLDLTAQDVARIVDLRHATKIDTIVAALAALGKELVIQLRAATPKPDVKPIRRVRARPVLARRRGTLGKARSVGRPA